MCILCMLLYLTKHIRTKHNNNNNNNNKRLNYSKRQSWSTFSSLREVEDGSSRKTSRSEGEVFLNQTDKLLEGAKRNLMLSIGVRKNMVHTSNQIRMRPLHNYMLYITEMYKNLSKNGLSSLDDGVGGCGREKGARKKRGLGEYLFYLPPYLEFLEDKWICCLQTLKDSHISCFHNIYFFIFKTTVENEQQLLDNGKIIDQTLEMYGLFSS